MSLSDRIQGALSGLNDRERKLLLLLGGIFVTFVVFLPAWFLVSAMGDMEEENSEIAELLTDIADARPQLAEREAERQASLARYRTAAPPLGSFIEAEAREQELSLREVTEQPEQELGEFRRRNTRATMPNVGLRPVVKMLTSIVNSRYPVALERLQVEHFRSGDTYNVQLGVVAYERIDTEEEGADDGESPRGRRSGRAGPPAPR